MDVGKYRIRITPRAQKDIRGLSGDNRSMVVDAIEGLKTNPRPQGVEKLGGYANAWRIRVRAFRICYQVFDAEVIVTVVRFGDRKDIYRLLSQVLKARG